MKPKGLSDINASRLKAFKKAQRESTVMVKSLVVQNKKKRASKRACRNFKF